MVMQYPFKNLMICYGAKGFLRYLKRCSACALNNYGLNNILPIAWTKIIQFMVFIEYLHEGIAFLLGLNFLFLGI